MLKKNVEYTDFDDNPSMETLYFNLTKSELTENLKLQDELEAIQELAQGDQRNLGKDEIRRVLDLVKTFMRISYGVRSADGKRFIKTDEQWEEFTQTAAYDSFLYSLFTEPMGALEFMTGIMPKDLRDQVRAETEKQMKTAGFDIPSAVQKAAELNSAPDSAIPPTSITKTEPARPTVVNLPAEETPAAEPTVELTGTDLEAFQAWQKANAQNGASK